MIGRSHSQLFIYEVFKGLILVTNYLIEHLKLTLGEIYGCFGSLYDHFTLINIFFLKLSLLLVFRLWAFPSWSCFSSLRTTLFQYWFQLINLQCLLLNSWYLRWMLHQGVVEIVHLLLRRHSIIVLVCWLRIHDFYKLWCLLYDWL